MITDLHRRLRAATRESHERLERDARVVARAGAPASRRLLVEAFHRLHVEAEAVPEPWLDGLLGLDFERRRRLPTLRRDLAAVGGRSDAAVGQLVVTSRCEALGVLYVLGGSTLGGRVKPGRIDVTVGEHRDRVRVIVADQGGGKQGPGEGFGSRMITAMVRQLRAELAFIDNKPGLRAILTAPVSAAAVEVAE